LAGKLPFEGSRERIPPRNNHAHDQILPASVQFKTSPLRKLNSAERLIEIVHQIVDILDPNRDADHALGYADLGPALLS
jgi:hypothetical protein